MPNVIKITANGIGRMIDFRTSNAFDGIYTENIETSIVVHIVGYNGSSLIHCTETMDFQTIIDEFKFHGFLSTWAIIYNPNYYPKGNDCEKLQAKIAPFIQASLALSASGRYNFKNKDKSMMLFTAPKGFVGPKKFGIFETEQKFNSQDIHVFENEQIRDTINAVNSYFLLKNESVTPDIQFDGFKFTPLPKLRKAPEQIQQIITTDKFKNDTNLELMLDKYKKILSLENIKIPSLDIKLKQDNSVLNNLFLHKVSLPFQNKPTNTQSVVANKRQWAPHYLREKWYPMLDKFAVRLAKSNIELDTPLIKYADKISKLGCHLYTLENNIDNLLAVINFKQSKDVHLLLDLFGKFFPKLKLQSMKSGNSFCLCIYFNPSEYNLEKNIDFIIKELDSQQLPIQFKTYAP